MRTKHFPLLPSAGLKPITETGDESIRAIIRALEFKLSKVVHGSLNLESALRWAECVLGGLKTPKVCLIWPEDLTRAEMESMFRDDEPSSSSSGSKSERKRPAYMADRSLIDERARAALAHIPHSKAPVYKEGDEGYEERAEERLHEAAVWLQSEKSKVSARHIC